MIRRTRALIKNPAMSLCVTVRPRDLAGYEARTSTMIPGFVSLPRALEEGRRAGRFYCAEAGFESARITVTAHCSACGGDGEQPRLKGGFVVRETCPGCPGEKVVYEDLLLRSSLAQ